MFSRKLMFSFAIACAGLIGLTSAVHSGDKNPATTPSPRLDKKGNPDPGWIKRHEGFVEIAKKGDINVVFLGDSITDAWRNFDATKKRGGKNVWDKTFAPLKAANFGIGGDRTQHVLWRLQNGELEGIKPKVVMLMIGTNNSNGKDNTAEEIADGIKAIVARLRADLPDTRILLLAIFPRGEKPNAQREKNAKASELASRAADGKTVHYVDIGAKFLEPDGTLSREIMPDALHLSPRGYRIWAEAIEPKIKELMGE